MGRAMKKQYFLTIVSLSLMFFSQNLIAQEAAFHFRLILPGESTNSSALFAEASGPEKEIETESVVGGGENRYKYKLPKTVKDNNLVLSRGIVNKDSELIKWCMNSVNGSIVPKNITLSLQNEADQPVFLWNFMKAYPVKCSMSNSSESMILLESVELAYLYFEGKQL